MIDTGTNLSISNSRILRALGCEIHKSSPPIIITFGNDTQSTSYTHAKLGGWIGDIHCVEDSTETLISIDSLERQKYVIVIENLVMYIISPLGETVMKITRCPSTQMYYADLSISPLLLTPTSPQVTYATNPLSIVATVHGARKLGPLNKITIAKVMWLHSRMNHPSRSVMAGALRNNAWIGIDDLSASDIERVLGKLDCIFCSQTKLNRLPVNFGSGIRPPFVGHTVSVDYKPCAPKGVGGYIGFYVFSCCLTLYLHVFLVKTHNATGLTSATEQD